jgi:hypothetical protein
MVRFALLAALMSGTLLQAASPPKQLDRSLRFEPNRGQVDKQIEWIARGQGFEVALSRDNLKMVVAGEGSTRQMLDMKLGGSHPWTDVTGLEPTGGVSNYLLGKDGQHSLSNIPHYRALRIAGVYDGIDLVLHNAEGKLEYDFVVHPGADPNQIRLSFAGQRGIVIDDRSGDLVVRTSSGFEFRNARPHLYQEKGNGRTDVAGSYRMLGGSEAAFQIGAYDHSQILTIDPTLIFTTLAKDAEPYGLATDPAGNIYMTGASYRDFQSTDGSQYQHCDHGFFGYCSTSNGFISKYSPAGELLFATYTVVGTGDAIAADSTGVYVTGLDMPAYDAYNLPGGNNLYVLKLNPYGEYAYANYYTGEGDDWGHAIGVDSQGNVWVAGETNPNTYPGPRDIVIRKIDPQGKSLDTQVIGGAGDDVPWGLAIDHSDNPWITGQTCSADFPASAGFNNLRGKCGVFVLGLTNGPAPAPIKWSSVFGGSDSIDTGYGIAVNSANEIYVTGVTSSQTFPVQQGAYQLYPSGVYKQAFVTKLDTLGHYIYSTYLGTDADTTGRSITVSASNEVYVAGDTMGTTFPGNGPLSPNDTTTSKGFVSKFSPDLSTLLYSRQVGSNSRGVALNEEVPAVTPSRIYVVGTVDSGQYDYSGYLDRLTDDYYSARLRNFWISDQYINTESGVAATSPIEPGWLSAQWDIAEQPPIPGDPAGTKVFWIGSHFHPDQFLNLETGSLQSSPIAPGALSARWTLELIPGTPNVYRIRNVFLPAYCLNIQSGTLAASPVEPGWWSAMWTVERVF